MKEIKGLVTRETDKYIYTTEVTWELVEEYFVISCIGQYGTVFYSEADARNAFDRFANMFNDHTPMRVEKRYNSVCKTYHHRYKK